MQTTSSVPFHESSRQFKSFLNTFNNNKLTFTRYPLCPRLTINWRLRWLVHKKFNDLIYIYLSVYVFINGFHILQLSIH